jgi:hypothetical protein
MPIAVGSEAAGDKISEAGYYILTGWPTPVPPRRAVSATLGALLLIFPVASGHRWSNA